MTFFLFFHADHVIVDFVEIISAPDGEYEPFPLGPLDFLVLFIDFRVVDGDDIVFLNRSVRFVDHDCVSFLQVGKFPLFVFLGDLDLGLFDLDFLVGPEFDIRKGVVGNGKGKVLSRSGIEFVLSRSGLHREGVSFPFLRKSVLGFFR